MSLLWFAVSFQVLLVFVTKLENMIEYTSQTHTGEKLKLSFNNVFFVMYTVCHSLYFQIQKMENRTTFMISNRLSTLEQCDMLTEMPDGQFIAIQNLY